MSLLEEINLRIEIYGGREVVAREIEKEWPLVEPRKWVRKAARANLGGNALGQWTQQQIDFLAANLQVLGPRAVGRLIGKSDRAVYSKACRMGLKSWYDPTINFYTKVSLNKKAGHF